MQLATLSGGAGNRTRVLRYQYRASTGVVCLALSQSRISYTRVFDGLIHGTVL
jgi:hypothetical protein